MASRSVVERPLATATRTAVDVDMAAAEVDVVGRAETKCAGCGHWTTEQKGVEPVGLLTWRARQGKLRPVVSERRSLVCPTRPARGGWLAVAASRGRLAGRRPRSGQGEGGQSETKRNRTTKKTGFLLCWSLTTVNPLSSCWTNVFFWVDVPIFLSIKSHQMALSP